MLSQITYTGDGSTEVFTIPFDFIKREFVKVEVDALPVGFSWESQQAVRISPAPTSGATVIIYRKTDISKPTIEFTNASVVSASAHNAAYRSNLHVVQEAYDSLDGVAERAQASAERAETESQEAQAARTAAEVARDATQAIRDEAEVIQNNAQSISDQVNTKGAEYVQNIQTLGDAKISLLSTTGDAKIAEVINEASVVNLPPGLIAHFAMAAIPFGWLYCNGQAVSRTVYSALFTQIGTTFGEGDGSTTFNVPDLRGRFINGYGNGYTLGLTGGAENVQLSASQIPDHTHKWYCPTGGSNINIDASTTSGNAYSWDEQGNKVNLTTDTLKQHLWTSRMTGVQPAQVHENRPPFMSLVPCIKAFGSIVEDAQSLQEAIDSLSSSLGKLTPSSTTKYGTVKLATVDEVQAGEDNEKAITAYTLKNGVTGVLKPFDLNRRVSITSGTNYTASSDGWIVYIAPNNSRQTGNIQINGVTVYRYHGDAGYFQYSTCLPVGKGDVYRINITAGGMGTGLFVPCK